MDQRRAAYFGLLVRVRVRDGVRVRFKVRVSASNDAVPISVWVGGRIDSRECRLVAK